MRCRGAAVVTLTTACVLAFGPTPARAASCSGVVQSCINDDTLWPHAGPARFLAVGSASTVRTGHIGFGLVTSYLSQPVVLQLASPGMSAGGTQAIAVNDQVNGTFLWSYGVTRRLELDVALPLTFGQGGTGMAPITGGPGLKDTAVRDTRFGFTFVVLARSSALPGDDAAAASEAPEDGGQLAARLEVSAPVGDSDQFAGEHSAVFIPSIAADLRLGRFFAAAELGARVRPIAEVLNARIGTQIVTALGAGVDLLPHHLLGVALEAWALPTLAAQQRVDLVGGAYIGTHDGTHVVPAEWQLSARSAPLRGDALSLQLGGGGGIPLSGELPMTTPRFRVTLGLRWSPGY
jgi:hypothetical protein